MEGRGDIRHLVVGRSVDTEFAAGLADRPYKLWNRLSSWSYFPPPVRRVDIPFLKAIGLEKAHSSRNST